MRQFRKSVQRVDRCHVLLCLREFAPQARHWYLGGLFAIISADRRATPPTASFRTVSQICPDCLAGKNEKVVFATRPATSGQDSPMTNRKFRDLKPVCRIDLHGVRRREHKYDTPCVRYLPPTKHPFPDSRQGMFVFSQKVPPILGVHFQSAGGCGGGGSPPARVRFKHPRPFCICGPRFPLFAGSGAACPVLCWRNLSHEPRQVHEKPRKKKTINIRQDREGCVRLSPRFITQQYSDRDYVGAVAGLAALAAASAALISSLPVSDVRDFVWRSDAVSATARYVRAHFCLG